MLVTLEDGKRNDASDCGLPRAALWSLVVKKIRRIASQPRDHETLEYSKLVSRIREEGRKSLRPDQPDPPTLRNQLSVLSGWMTFFGRLEKSKIGKELAEDHTAALDRYLAHEKARGSAASTLRDRRYHLRRIRDHVDFLRSNDLPWGFADCLSELMERSGIGVVELSRRTGVSREAIAAWAKGRRTPCNIARLLPRFEEALQAPKGALTSRVPRIVRDKYTKKENEPVIRTPYGEKLSRLRRGRYHLTNPSDALVAEIRAYVTYKTALIPTLARTLRGRWVTRPRRKLRYFAHQHLAYVGNDGVSPTAILWWTTMRQYLGWLALPYDQGGKGLPPAELQTIAWVVFPDLVMDHLAWRMERNEGVPNSFVVNFAQTVRAMIRPGTGFLAQQPVYLSRLPAQLQPTIKDWAAHCAEAYRKLGDYIAMVKPHVLKSRDPWAPISSLVARDRPLEPILAMLRRMEEDMPPRTCPRARAIQMRRIALLTLLVANPLRINQMGGIEVSKGPDDMSSNLYKTADGQWRLRFPVGVFKNHQGAAKDKHYDAMVPSWAWPRVERYLTEARPVLLDGREAPLLFVGFNQKDLDKPGSFLSDDVRHSVKRYLPGSPGFGPHSLRHIVATHWLKTRHNDYPYVAMLLHDTLETVMSTYSHLRHDSVFGSYDNLLHAMEGRQESVAGARP
jgi:integrase